MKNFLKHLLFWPLAILLMIITIPFGILHGIGRFSTAFLYHLGDEIEQRIFGHETLSGGLSTFWESWNRY